MSDTSRRRGHKRSQKLLQNEKEKVRERLAEMEQLKDGIVNYVNNSFFEANQAAAKLLRETSKSKFFSKYVDVTVVLNKCYARLINLNHFTDSEDEGSLDSSSSSSQSTGSLNSIVSAFSSATPSVSVTREKDLSLTADPKAGGDSQNCAASLNSCNEEVSGISDEFCSAGPSQTRDSNQSLNSCVTVVEVIPRVEASVNNDSKSPQDKISKEIISPEVTSLDIADLSEESEEKEIATFRCQITKTSSPQEVKSSATKIQTSSPRDLKSSATMTQTSPPQDEKSSAIKVQTSSPQDVKNSAIKIQTSSPRDLKSFATMTQTSPPRDVKSSATKIQTPSPQDLKSPATKIQNRAASPEVSASVPEKEIEQDETKIRVMPFKFKSNARTEVMVAFAKSPSDFWAQFLGEKYDTTNLEIAVRNHCIGPKSINIGKELNIGLHCCAWDQADDLWCRAEVTRIKYSDKEGPSFCPLFVVCSVEVCHLDTGAMDAVHPDLLRDISEECAAIPAAATRCTLAGICPLGQNWSPDCVETFKSLVEGQVFIMVVHCYLEDGRALVELHHTDKTTKIPNVSDYLAHYKYASRSASDRWMETSSNKSSDNLSCADIKEEQINLKSNRKSDAIPALLAEREDDSEHNHTDGDVFTWSALIPNPHLPNTNDVNIYIDYIENPSSFFAQIVTPKDVSNYNFVRDRLNKLQQMYDCKIGPPVLSAVSPGTCWAAKCNEDGLWYRVRVLSPDKEVAVSTKQRCVRFIDYGSAEWISSDNLRPLLKVLTDYPAFVYRFSLAHIVPNGWSDNRSEWKWSETATTKFKELVEDVGNFFNATIVDCDPHRNSNTIPVILYDMDDTRSRSINSELVDFKLAQLNPPRPDENETEDSEDLNAVFENWNPMASDFHSERNMYGLDTDDPGVATTGLSARNDRAVCKRFNYNKCHDPYCKFEHRLYDDMPSNVERIVAKAETVMKDLRSGMRLVVTVSAVFNPGHFYVILPLGAYDIVEMKSNENYFENKLKASEDIRTLKKELNEHYNNKLAQTRKNPNILYSESQLVAAKVNEIWYRARVLRVLCEEHMLEIECVDYGSNEFVSESDVAPLLPEFLYLPLQAVECFLTNVEPVGRKKKLSWCKASRDWFETQVSGNFLVATIEYCDINAVYINLFDTSTVPNKHINDGLVKKGYAVKTN